MDNPPWQADSSTQGLLTPGRHPKNRSVRFNKETLRECFLRGVVLLLVRETQLEGRCHLLRVSVVELELPNQSFQ